MRVSFSIQRAAVIAVLAAVVMLVPGVTFAQTIQPKAKWAGDFAIKDANGAPLHDYEIFYYFEAGKSAKDSDAHVFYAPPFHVALDETNKIKQEYDESEERLTLWVQRPAPSNSIKQSLREQIRKDAVQSRVEIARGTDPYLIKVLPVTEAFFEFSSDQGIRSDSVKAAISQNAAVSIYFDKLSKEKAEQIVQLLEDDRTQLKFVYQFKGVEDEVCTATAKNSRFQGIKFFEKKRGKGRKGYVTRHGATKIANDLNEQKFFKVRCGDKEVTRDLFQVLLEKAGEPKELQVAGWKDLQANIQFDSNDFLADIKTELKKTKNTVSHTQVLEATSTAYSEASSDAGEGGVKVGIPGKAELGVSGSGAGAESEVSGKVKKDFDDILTKKGWRHEWRGKVFIPKSVDVYSVADLRARWGRAVGFQVRIPGKTVSGRGEYLLSANDRSAYKNRQVVRSVDRLLAAERAERKKLEERLKKLEPAVVSIQKFFYEKPDEVYLRSVKKPITIKTSGARKGVRISADDDVRIRADDDVSIRADDDVRIIADDDVSIRADDDVNIEALTRTYWVGHGRDRKRKVSVGRMNLAADGNVKIRAYGQRGTPGNIEFRAKGKFLFNGKPHISVDTCFYEFDWKYNDINAFYSVIGKKEESIANVASVRVGQEVCKDDGPIPNVDVVRVKKDNRKWALRIDNYQEKCGLLRVKITFMRGFGVRKDLSYDTGKTWGERGKLVPIRQWCGH